MFEEFGCLTLGMMCW